MKQTLIDKHKFKVINRYRQGERPDDICLSIGISRSTVYRILKICGIKLRPRTSVNKIEIDEEQVIKLFNNDISTSEIASRFCIGGWVVRKILKRHGLKPSGKRKVCVPHNKTKIDNNLLTKAHGDGKTTKEISKIFNCKSHVILSRLKEIGLKPNISWNESTNLRSQIGEFAYNKLSNKKWLYKKYVVDNMSTRKIAKEIGWGKKAVNTFVTKYRFNKHDIKISKEDFIKRAHALHGEKYDYSNIDYKSYQEHIEIKCRKHGMFWQVPKYHIKNKNGCPSCAGTHLQSEIYEFVNSISNNKVVNNDRSILLPYELDIYIPDRLLAIEVNGMYWHSFNHVENKDERNIHAQKVNKCVENNIFLIQIAEYEWLYKKQIVKSVIKSKLGVSDRIYARKCEVCKLETPEYREFINKNHLQGYNHSHIIYGLKHKNEVVAVMSFNKHKKHEWEITRFANKLEITVVGGASRLFKKFIKEINPNQVITYADRRYSDGNLYKKLGFKLIKTTRPNYVYIKGLNYFSRQQFQKHKLKNKLENFDPNLTEAENMFNNGFRRMWDSGNHKFLWKRRIRSILVR